ncbi:hypothetical protein_gp261 [Bacillus phage vB_BceM_WH1]|nr:hypothetical protein_gp261 [Bacillus phage vB_BceM_WH1]
MVKLLSPVGTEVEVVCVISEVHKVRENVPIRDRGVMVRREIEREYKIFKALVKGYGGGCHPALLKGDFKIEYTSDNFDSLSLIHIKNNYEWMNFRTTNPLKFIRKNNNSIKDWKQEDERMWKEDWMYD